MESTNSAPAEVSPQDPVAAIAGILEAEKAPPPQDDEQETDVPETEDAAEPSEEGDDAEAETADPESDDDTDEVEYEGETYRLPKKLKDALLRNADYTRKTQEVAEARRLVEAQHAQIAAQAEMVAQQQQFQQAMAPVITEAKVLEQNLQQFKQVNWQALSNSDPVQAQQLWFQYQETQSKYNELTQTINQNFAQFQQHSEKARQEQLAKAMEILKKDMPDFGPQKVQEMREAAQAYGFTAVELQNITDPRTVKLLADAAAYRKLQASKAAVNKRVPPPVKTVKPGQQTTSKQRTQASITEAKTRLRKTGRMDDAVSVISKLI